MFNNVLSTFDEKETNLSLTGTLRGHNDWVTSLAASGSYRDRLISVSRDKSLLIWKLNFDGHNEVTGVPVRRLKGHSHFITNVVLSVDSDFALTSSWDKTLRLWDLKAGFCKEKFIGHTGDVLGVDFSCDNRQIVSCSRDKTVRLWNTLGHNKYIMNADDGHKDWVSSIKISPNYLYKNVIITGGWDSSVRTWDLTTCKYSNTLQMHTNAVYCVSISPDGTLLATGGKDHNVCLWDMGDERYLYSLTWPGEVNALAFCPNRYWLAAAYGDTIILYNLETRESFEQIKTEFTSSQATSSTIVPHTMSLVWSSDGNILFSGHTDGVIRMWKVMKKSDNAALDNIMELHR